VATTTISHDRSAPTMAFLPPQHQPWTMTIRSAIPAVPLPNQLSYMESSSPNDYCNSIGYFAFMDITQEYRTTMMEDSPPEVMMCRGTMSSRFISPTSSPPPSPPPGLAWLGRSQSNCGSNHYDCCYESHPDGGITTSTDIALLPLERMTTMITTTAKTTTHSSAEPPTPSPPHQVNLVSNSLLWLVTLVRHAVLA
jgi:hypothetical protein